MSRPAELPSAEGKAISYVSGIDIGSQSCLGCICRADKRVVVKPMEFANTQAGWKVFEGKLEHLGVPPSTILVGMEATARYGENLSVRPDVACVEWSASSQRSRQGCLQSLSASLVTVG
jgi:transposase